LEIASVASILGGWGLRSPKTGSRRLGRGGEEFLEGGTGKCAHPGREHGKEKTQEETNYEEKKKKVHRSNTPGKRIRGKKSQRGYMESAKCPRRTKQLHSHKRKEKRFKRIGA